MTRKKRERKQYSETLKARAVKLANASSSSASNVARELGVAEKTLHCHARVGCIRVGVAHRKGAKELVVAIPRIRTSEHGFTFGLNVLKGPRLTLVFRDNGSCVPIARAVKGGHIHFAGIDHTRLRPSEIQQEIVSELCGVEEG